MPAPRKPAAKPRAARKTTLKVDTLDLKDEATAAAFVQAVELTEEQRFAKVQAYGALQGAGLPIPAGVFDDVKQWIKEEEARRREDEKAIKQAQKALQDENEKGPWYVRNLYPGPFSLRLDRQTEKRRIELKPRGVPGDLHPLQEGDLNDPILKRNCATGLCEVIPAGEARLIIEKQTTNMGERRHNPLIEMLRGPGGKEYAPGAVKLEAEYNSQGVTVATNDPRLATGQLTDKELARHGGLNRVPSTVSGFVPTGGNPSIISDGFNPPPQPGSREASDTALRIADDIARRKGSGGLGAGLGNLQVTVAPTERN